MHTSYPAPQSTLWRRTKTKSTWVIAWLNIWVDEDADGTKTSLAFKYLGSVWIYLWRYFKVEVVGLSSLTTVAKLLFLTSPYPRVIHMYHQVYITVGPDCFNPFHRTHCMAYHHQKYIDLNLATRNLSNGNCEDKTPLYNPSKIFHKHRYPPRSIKRSAVHVRNAAKCSSRYVPHLYQMYGLKSKQAPKSFSKKVAHDQTPRLFLPHALTSWICPRRLPHQRLWLQRPWHFFRWGSSWLHRPFWLRVASSLDWEVERQWPELAERRLQRHKRPIAELLRQWQDVGWIRLSRFLPNIVRVRQLGSFWWGAREEVQTWATVSASQD